MLPADPTDQLNLELTIAAHLAELDKAYKDDMERRKQGQVMAPPKPETAPAPPAPPQKPRMEDAMKENPIELRLPMDSLPSPREADVADRVERAMAMIDAVARLYKEGEYRAAATMLDEWDQIWRGVPEDVIPEQVKQRRRMAYTSVWGTIRLQEGDDVE